MLKFLGKYRETGLLLLRASIGLIFILICGPVLLGGTRNWAHLGSTMHALNFHAHMAGWGFAGALAGCIGGVLMIIGLFFRLGILCAVLITIVDIIATLKTRGELQAGLQPIEIAIISSLN
ncbi:MAG: hypothetical protein ABI871_03815 [Chthoniobacterales bacterium]